MAVKSLWGFTGGASGKESACRCKRCKDMGLIPGSGRSVEKGKATYSSILAWKIPWTEESGGLQLVGSQELDMSE